MRRPEPHTRTRLGLVIVRAEVLACWLERGINDELKDLGTCNVAIVGILAKEPAIEETVSLRDQLSLDFADALK
jgi:hypothetical protein